MSKLLTVSPSPHISGNESVSKLMFGVVLAMLPAFGFSVWYFGISAIIVTSVSVISCVAFEYLIQKFLLKSKVRISDGSAIVTGILLAFNLPSSIPWWMIVLGSLFAIGIGKMAYGGLGNNPFNPALAGQRTTVGFAVRPVVSKGGRDLHLGKQSLRQPKSLGLFHR